MSPSLHLTMSKANILTLCSPEPVATSKHKNTSMYHIVTLASRKAKRSYAPWQLMFWQMPLRKFCLMIRTCSVIPVNLCCAWGQHYEHGFILQCSCLQIYALRKKKLRYVTIDAIENMFGHHFVGWVVALCCIFYK